MAAEKEGKTTSNDGTTIKPILRDFLDARGFAQEFARPQFETAVRMYRLYAGHMPPEIEGTFSQVMLWFPWAIIQDELPNQLQAMIRMKQWLTLKANDVMLQPTVKTATKWVRHQMEATQQFQRTSLPSIQSSLIFGNGYRLYGTSEVPINEKETLFSRGKMGIIEDVSESTKTEMRKVITGEYTNYFNVLPSPSGSVINPSGSAMESGLDYLIVYIYPPKKWTENLAEKGIFDKNEVAKMLDKNSGTDPEEDITIEYKTQLGELDGAWNTFQQPEWVNQMKEKKNGLEGRNRIAIFYQRDKWAFIGEDKYVLYEGPPWFPFWNLTSFKTDFNLDNFFSYGLLRVVEDLLISMIMNFNMRLDYLAGRFHPMRYIPQKLLDDVGGDLSAFDWEPYKVVPYQHGAYAGGLQNHMFVDGQPEITQQAFLEQSQMKEYLEEIISQQGVSSISGESATGNQNLMSQTMARKMLRAVETDLTGVHDSVEMTLKLGSIFVNENEMINTGAEGLPFERINHQAIRDGYDIEITGARNMALAEETFRRQISIIPLLQGDPGIRGQVEAKRQIMEHAPFDNVDTIINGVANKTPVPLGESSGMPGGVPSSQNDMSSRMGRNTVEAGTGRSVSAAGVGSI